MPKHLTDLFFKSLLSYIMYTSHVNKLVHLMLPQLAHKFTLRLCVYALYECFHIRRY